MKNTVRTVVTWAIMAVAFALPILREPDVDMMVCMIMCIAVSFSMRLSDIEDRL